MGGGRPNPLDTGGRRVLEAAGACGEGRGGLYGRYQACCSCVVEISIVLTTTVGLLQLGVR
jgi:hypothetical protein